MFTPSNSKRRRKRNKEPIGKFKAKLIWRKALWSAATCGRFLVWTFHGYAGMNFKSVVLAYS